MAHAWRARLGAGILGAGLLVSPLLGQTPAPVQSDNPAAGAPDSSARLPVAASGVSAPASASTPTTPEPPADYLIGTDDVLSVVFWRDQEMTTDVVVRPDGRISLPVLNELDAAGLTPEQLRQNILAVAAKYFEEPSVNIVVKQINSRKVSITGEVAKPGQYPLGGGMTVLQLIAAAGGLLEYAKKDEIAVIRMEETRQTRFRVNYKDVMKGKNLSQNIELKIGDVVIVP